jgi:uncharacterized protein
MRLGIVSDTHDNIALISQVVNYFSDNADAVIHCGDAVSPFSVKLFNTETTDFDFDFYYVRGNNDGEWNLKPTVESFGHYMGEMGERTFGTKKFAIYHGTTWPIVDALVECGIYDYVLHGHTHKKEIVPNTGNSETVRINPGGIPAPFPEADNTFHVALLDTETDKVTFQPFN